MIDVLRNVVTFNIESLATKDDVKQLRSDNREAFIDLWESINGEGSWGLDPWVWVVGFRLMESPPEWDKSARSFCVIAEQMLKTHFGERCPSSDPDCEICKRWHLLAQLVSSPYDVD